MTKDNTVLMGVFAHPDDEVLISGLLYRAHSQGIKTHLVCATRGESGGFRNHQVVNKENLAVVRERELENSCKILGISSLIYLDLADSGSSTWYKEKPEEKLLEIIQNIKPDIVITFDENGGNGHPDHREIHSLTVNVFKKYKKSDEQKLYYFTLFPKSYIQRFCKILPLTRKLKDKFINKITVDDSKVTTMLKLKKEEKKNKLDALACHKSQFPDKNGKYYKMPYFIFKIFSSYECYFLYNSKEVISDNGYRIVDML